jgi:hypothetical protein
VGPVAVWSILRPFRSAEGQSELALGSERLVRYPRGSRSRLFVPRPSRHSVWTVCESGTRPTSCCLHAHFTSTSFFVIARLHVTVGLSGLLGLPVPEWFPGHCNALVVLASRAHAAGRKEATVWTAAARGPRRAERDDARRDEPRTIARSVTRTRPTSSAMLSAGCGGDRGARWC